MASLHDGGPDERIPVGETPAKLVAGLEEFRVRPDMSTKDLATAAAEGRRIVRECLEPLHAKFDLFLRNLIGPKPRGEKFYINDNCEIFVSGGRVIVLNFYAPQEVNATRKLPGHDLNLLGILAHSPKLIDDFSEGRGAMVSFAVSLERFDRIVAGGPDSVRNAYPLLVDDERAGVSGKVAQAAKAGERG